MTTLEEQIQPVVEVKKKLLTEDLGKMFEMAICLTFGIPYDGKYKYGMELPEELKPRLSKLVELFPCAQPYRQERGSLRLHIY